MHEVRIVPVVGIGEVTPGFDLASAIVEHTELPLEDGDILVVTSKVISKAEGRIVPGDDREVAIDTEAVRTVATVGTTRIVETRHGLVMAAAGVDASNIEQGSLVLLPLDPDRSASLLRAQLKDITGLNVAVIISDTAGRAWREGQTDMAIGASGINPMVDMRGIADTHGRVMDATIVAVADELAGAGDLVKGKLGMSPVAIVRGLSPFVVDEDGPGARAIVRDAEMDLFRLGTREAKAEGAREAVSARRSVRSFTDQPVERAKLDEAITAALTAPAPHHSQPFRFVIVDQLRRHLLAAMEQQWREDLESDGIDSPAIDRRIGRGQMLWKAPALIVPCMVRHGSHSYPDERRATGERRMFDLAAGAAVEGLLVQLAALGLGSCWVSSTLFCPEVAIESLRLPQGWEPLGAVAIGYPSSEPKPRPDGDPSRFVLDR